MHGVLQSRLLPPRLPAALVPRTELVGGVVERMDDRLVTVVAGAGYGKTTLLASRSTAWTGRGSGARATSASTTGRCCGTWPPAFAGRVPGFGARLA